MVKTVIQGFVLSLALFGTAFGQSDEGLKVFISVDMEGVTGVVNVDDASRNGKDYDYFRQTMTREANAAIEGALAAGATEIIVRDSHGSALNLHPEEARDQIRAGVEKALRNLDDYKPYKLSAPYTLVLTMKTEQSIYEGALYPGAKRTGDWELTYVANDVMEAMAAYRGMRR